MCSVKITPNFSFAGEGDDCKQKTRDCGRRPQGVVEAEVACEQRIVAMVGWCLGEGKKEEEENQ